MKNPHATHNAYPASEALFQSVRQMLACESPAGRRRRHLWLIGLSEARRVQFIEHLGAAGRTGWAMAPRDIVRRALAHGSSHIVAGHSHSDGSILPGDDDKAFAAALLEAAALVAVEVVDFLILSTADYFSFTDHHLLTELPPLTTSLSPDAETRLKNEALKLGEKMGLIKGLERGMKAGRKLGVEEGRAQARREIARLMLHHRESPRRIARFTGLTEAEIAQLPPHS